MQVVTLLCEHGANVLNVCEDNEKGVEKARRGAHWAVVEYLQQREMDLANTGM